MIPPHIPLPSSKNERNNDEKEDLFATLFSPSTPRASPTPGAAPDEHFGGVSSRHTRTASTDSDFGAFVSVSSTEHPLNHMVEESSPNVPFSPLQNLEFYDRLAEDAMAATERNRKGVLDELLEHEDDPLYFLHTSGVEAQGLSGMSTPIPPPGPQSIIDLSPTSAFWNSNPFAQERSEQPRDEEYAEERQSRHPTRHANQTEPATMPTPSFRAPSIPPSLAPESPQTQSVVASSSFSSSAFPKRWVSSLLSRPGGRRAVSEDDAEQISTANRHSPSPPASGIVSHSRMHSSTLDPSPSITHGTPFASEPFVPPSGAPGFAGDRSWNTSQFEFDREKSEKKSVRLIGRREMTTPILTTVIADLIRPHFPALARLHRSWTLLYSLDQHGISLNTLYTRCESHKGSAVVIMQDSNNALFGAWVGEGIHNSRGSYYGGGESFLWKLLPEGLLRVYKWTAKNDYVALCEPEYISFGGGDGHYGLYLDDTLSDGSSAPCPTFNNEPLCSAGPRQGDNITFECVGLEVWGMG